MGGQRRLSEAFRYVNSEGAPRARMRFVFLTPTQEAKARQAVGQERPGSPDRGK